MNGDLEMLVMQYLDGTMPEADRPLFESLLENDARARELLREHQAMDDLLKNQWTMPDINWEMLRERLSESIAEEKAPLVRRYKIDFARTGRRMALAACLFIAGGISVHVYLSYRAAQNQPGNGGIAQVETKPAPTVPGHLNIDVAVAGIEAPEGHVVSEVTIGPPASLAGGSAQIGVADGVMYRAPRVIIASGAESAQDDVAQSSMY